MRYVYIILFFIVLVAPFVVRRAVGVRSGQEPAAPAGRGEALELTIITPHNQDIRRAFARAFDAWHRAQFGQAVKVTYLTPGGTNDIVRYIADLYGAQRDPRTQELPPPQTVRAPIELVWGGGDTTFDRELKPFLQPVKLDSSVLKAAFPTPDLNGVALYERTPPERAPKWVGTVLSSFGIVYNPTLYETLGLAPPESWSDLDDPRLAGFVALADPTRSGSAALTYMMAIQRGMADAEGAFLAAHPELKGAAPDALAKNAAYQAALGDGWKRGMRVLQLMAANSRYFTDSASQVPNDVGNGDAAAGVAIDFYARVYEQEIGSSRIRYVAPRGATAITPDPIAVLYGVRGQHEVLANRFIEFVLSPDGQRLWDLKPEHSAFLQRSLRRTPVRRDVYADQSQWADPDVNPFRDAGDFNLRGEWLALFADTRPIWAAAWIDTRQALKDAYDAALAVDDPARRAALIFDLSNLPIELKDVAEQNAERKRLEQAARTDPSIDVRLWMTQKRVAWARAFRRHDQAVAERAKE